MRFVTYETEHEGVGRELVGVVDGGMVHELQGVTRLVDLLGEVDTLRRAGERALEGGGRGVPLAEVRLRAPIPMPPSVRDFMAFEQHVLGTLLNQGPDVQPPKVFYRQPIFYFSNPAAIIGPEDDVPMPPGTRSFDFELEVAAVVGGPGADLSVAEASKHIVGYTMLIDWSARDIQSREMQGSLGPAKGKDTATTLGPWLVTADELVNCASGPSFSLAMDVELNGQPFGSDRLDHMGWSFAQMVAYASRGTRVVPGDVLGSGTCGNGCLAEQWGRRGPDAPRRVLRPGDEVTFRVQELGEITQRVVDGPKPLDIGAFWQQEPTR